ncbi:hypothetical protein HZS_974 [Henneguya salminicola]|nr:hypothetical protein HZS_974 [Henneguya salminicola]
MMLFIEVFTCFIIKDIKPSNILLNSSGEVKICDFGVSGKLIDSMANTFVGTRSYMAPERLQGTKYSVRSDIWSLGILLVELVTGRYPYPPISQETLVKLLQKPPPTIDNTQQTKESNTEEDLAIFELLDYIVQDEPPKLLDSFFSKEICDFVSQWFFSYFLHISLKKHPAERSDIEALLKHDYLISNWDLDISVWIKKIMNIEDLSKESK